jgi:BlaR1 peptidase M56
MLSSAASSWNALVPVAASWLLTYAMHSTLLLGAAWLATSRLVRSNVLRDLIWKAALVGGLITTTAQVSGAVPAALRWELRPYPFAMLWEADRAPIPVFEEQVVLQRGDSTIRTPRTALEPDLLTRTPSDPIAQADVPAARIWAALVGFWLAGAAGMLIRLGIQQARLSANLGRRAVIAEGPLAQMFAELCGLFGTRRRIRLTCAANIASPIALGGEICIPTRAFNGLNPDQQSVMLAHELAHILRRDPAWLLIQALLECVFFFHPLHRLACNRLRETAEYICDDWAVRQTGKPLALAKCLAEVAGWLVAGSPQASVAGMTSGGGRLVFRVQRLLGEPRDQIQQRPRGWPLLLLAGLLLVGCAAPVIAIRPMEQFMTSAHIEHSGDTRLQITTTGVINYTSDHADVQQISPGGAVAVVEQRDGVTRSLTIRPTVDGALQRSYTVQGREQPFDTEARAWLAEVIPRIADPHSR